MKQSLFSSLLAGAMLVTAGASTGWAGTITFNNSATNPEGFFTTDNTVSVWDDSGAGILPLLNLDPGACDPSGQAASGCPDLTTGIGTADYSGVANDYQYNGGGIITATSGVPALSFPSGPTLGTESSGPLTEVVDDVCQSVPALCPGAPSGALTTDTLNTALDVVPAGLGGDNQDLLVTVADPVGIAAVPESGSLMLVGMGLVAGAKFLRRRKVA